MKIILIRHGETKGNAEKRYIGKTDEYLTPDGIKKLSETKKTLEKINADVVISSPMKRCIQTADILFGRADEICVGLRECDFGEFENKNYNELKNSPEYIKWLESWGNLPFPGGESHKEFCMRCCESFEHIVYNYADNSIIAFVIHGGSIMAVCERYAIPHKSFYSRQPPNGGALFFEASCGSGGLVLLELY